MNELIPINMNDPERITVSARDLHEFLEVETRLGLLRHACTLPKIFRKTRRSPFILVLTYSEYRSIL